MTQIWPFLNFPKKCEKGIFSTPKTRLSTKIANSNERIAKKCKKTSILGILGQNGQFWTGFGQNGRNRIFFKKALGTFFPPLQALTNCKDSEKSNERILSNRVTDGRTDGRTEGQT